MIQPSDQQDKLLLLGSDGSSVTNVRLGCPVTVRVQVTVNRGLLRILLAVGGTMVGVVRDAHLGEGNMRRVVLHTQFITVLLQSVRLLLLAGLG